MKKRPKLEGCNNLQIGVKSILQKINPIKRINEKKKMDNGQPQDINKREFIKKGIFGIGIGAAAALLSKIPFARAVQNINYDNSTDGIAINSNGNVSLPNQSASLIWLSGAQAITDATATKMQFDTEQYDVKNEHDAATNYRFTATTAGKYLVLARTYIYGSLVDQKYIRLSIYKNGSDTNKYGGQVMASGVLQNYDAQAHGVLDLGVNDYVEIYAYHNHGAGNSLHSNQSHFSVTKVA